MADVDVIESIKRSYKLLESHYKEVALPIIILLLINAGGTIGGSLMKGGRSDSSSFSSYLSNAMDGAFLFYYLAATTLVIIAIGAVFIVAMTVLYQAVYFYVCEHFYSIMRKNAIKESWQGRMKRLALKAFVLLVFWSILVAVIFALPVLSFFDSMGKLAGGAGKLAGFGSLVEALMPSILLLLAAAAVLLVVHLFLLPLWVFYAMDGYGFFESISKSVDMVRGSIFTFFAFMLVFVALGVAGVVVSIASCCLSYIVSPIVTTFIGLLSGITLMDIVLQLKKS